MRKLCFQVFERNEEICVKTNIAEKFIKIGWSELCWNFSTIYKDGSDNYRFCWNFSLENYIFAHRKCWSCDFLNLHQEILENIIFSLTTIIKQCQKLWIKLHLSELLVLTHISSFFSNTWKYRSGTVNSKSFVGKVLLWIKWKFELN